MTNTMTPSEIADLEFKLKSALFQIEACDEQIERQAATIRDLEVRADRNANTAMQFNEIIGGLSEKLKIATEALEDIKLGHSCPQPLARKALARMKEVG